MNDFTKEELQLLLRYSEHLDYPVQQIAEARRLKLSIKLQSMIDNYEICGLCNRCDCQECPCR